MKKFFFKILIFLLILFNFKITNAFELKFDGLSKLSLADIQSLVIEDISKDYLTNIELNNIIKQLYDSDLIYDVSYQKIDEKVYIEIKEAKLIENIFINGNIYIEDEFLINLLNSKESELLTKSDLDSDGILIRNLYLNRGFKDISYNLSTEKFSQEKVNLIIEINEGKQKSINNINFNGNYFFSDKFLKNIIKSESVGFFDFFSKGSAFNEELFQFDLNLIYKKYKEFGFFESKISYELTQNSLGKYDLTFYIEEGSRTLIHSVKHKFLSKFLLDQEEELSTYIIDKLNKNDNFFIQSLVDSHLENLSKISLEQNFPNTYFESTIEYGELNTLVIKQIIENPVLINQIIIQGNSITKDSTIRSKLNFESGEYLNFYKINNSKNKLSNLKYINKVNISKNNNNKNSTNIFIDIEENLKTGNFSVAGALSGDTGLGFSLGLKDVNFLGSGNELNSTINLNSEKSTFRIDYSQYPYSIPNLKNRYTIFNVENDLISSFGYKSRNYGISYSLEFLQNQNISISSGIKIQNTKGYSKLNDNPEVLDSIGNFDNLILDLNFDYNKLNNFLYPTNGSAFNLNFEIAPEGISDDNFYKINMSADYYKKFQNSNNFVFTVNNFGHADTFTGNLKTINSYSLGGLNFKGFDYRGIGPFNDDIYLGGNNYFTSSVGYGSSFLFDEKDNINFRTFYTMGSIWDSDYTSNSDIELRSSVGLSFDLLTPVGPLTLIYAMPIEKSSSDIKRNFNFTLGTSF